MKSENDGKHRTKKLERQIQEVVARSISRDLKDEMPYLVTVSRVQVQGDFKSAKVFISVLAPGEDEVALKKNAARFLQKNAGVLQEDLDHELKLRFCPKLTFLPDESLEKVLKVEGLLADLQKKGK